MSLEVIKTISDLFGDELEGRFPDAVVDVAGSFQDRSEGHPGDADALDDGATHQRRRVELQVTQVRADDRAVGIRRVLPNSPKVRPV